MPSFSKDDAAQVVDYGRAQGFTDQELGSIVDARVVAALHKATQYDLVKAEAENVRGQGQKPRGKRLKPGSRQRPSSSKSKNAKEHRARVDRFRQTGNTGDAANLLHSVFGDDV